MSFTILCCLVVTFYVTIWFFDSFFKSCMHYPYFAFLEGTGLKIGIFNFSWKTTAFNRCIYRWSKNLNRFLGKWFAFGYFITTWLLLPFALWTIFSYVANYFIETVEVSTTPEVRAMLPGVNVPVSDFWIYFLSIGLCSILHEMGHAMAAGHEDVPLLSVGFYVFTIIPIAFVNFQTDHMNSLSRIKQLKIYCAGVWHNIVTAFIALLLFFSSPILFSLAYETDLGIRVTGFSDNSPLNQDRGLHEGDVITHINTCEIKNMDDWSFCLHLAYDSYGICTSTDFLAQNDDMMQESVKENNVVECCRPEDRYSFCFEYMEPKVGAAESTLPLQYACLKPREMIKHKFIKCTEMGDYLCPRNMHCMKPGLQNHTYLLIIQRKEKEPVIYFGIPYDLHKTVNIDQYFPRNVIFSHFSPLQAEKVLRYIFIFSMGIALLNVIPCYGTDGYFISKIIIQILGKFFGISNKLVSNISIFTVVIGTIITIPTLVHLFWREIFVDNNY